MAEKSAVLGRWPLIVSAALAVVALTLYLFGVRIIPLEQRRFDAAAAVAAAKAYDVTIRRDGFGVPDILGARDADAAFGLAYAHAEDDFATIQSSLRQVRGPDMIAENEAEARIAYLFQLFGIRARVEREYEKQLTAEARALVEGYAAGLNPYAAQHPDEVLPGLFPVTGQDIVALTSFFEPLFYGMSGTLARLTGSTQQRQIRDGQGMRVESFSDRLFAWEDSLPPHLGSNAFAVAPSRSTDGATRLIINSHQPITGPLAWYEARMRSGEGLDFAGGAFPGGPTLYLGANPDLGFAATTNRPDLIDVYRLVLNPDDPGQYRLDGAWKTLERGNAQMLVRLWGPIGLRVTRETLRSAHGPALETRDGLFAIRYATMDDIRYVDQSLAMMKARTLEAFERALALNAHGGQNRIAADRTGAIARYYVAKMPKRPEGQKWRDILPGDRSDLIWTEWEPFTALPHQIRPEIGFVVEANSSPFGVSQGPDAPKPEQFPAAFGIETEMTNRGRRAVALFLEKPKLSREDVLAAKFDDQYAEEGLTADLRRQILETDWGADPDLADAKKLIADWDMRLDFENRGAALAMLTMQPIGAAMHLGKEPPSLEDSFKAAVKTLKTHHGRLDPPWRDVNRLYRGEKSVPVSGGPDVLRSASSELRDDGRLSVINGDNLVIHVEWDKNGRQTISTIMAYGNSQRPDSPHYADQMELFSAMRLKEAPMAPEAVAAATKEAYRPQSAHERPRTGKHPSTDGLDADGGRQRTVLQAHPAIRVLRIFCIDAGGGRQCRRPSLGAGCRRGRHSCCCRGAGAWRSCGRGWPAQAVDRGARRRLGNRCRVLVVRRARLGRRHRGHRDRSVRRLCRAFGRLHQRGAAGPRLDPPRRASVWSLFCDRPTRRDRRTSLCADDFGAWALPRDQERGGSHFGADRSGGPRHLPRAVPSHRAGCAASWAGRGPRRRRSGSCVAQAHAA
jgi:penicillin amidase/acyl-homoserine-lactone acylase